MNWTREEALRNHPELAGRRAFLLASLAAGATSVVPSVADAAQAGNATDQSWHGRGVAQALMQRVELEASRRGGRTLWLGVWEHNARAKAFYRKNGFVDVGSHVFMVGTDAQTDRIWVRPLSSAITDVTE
jgi:GNAT superfamily N-acetyltransferase